MSTCLCKVLACSDISLYITDQKTSNVRPLVTHSLVTSIQDIMQWLQVLLSCLALVGRPAEIQLKDWPLDLGASHPGTAKEVEMSSGQLDGGVAAKG